MIRANIEAEIEAIKKRKDQNYKDIMTIDIMIEFLKKRQKLLLDKDNDYNFRLSELEELKEQL